MVRTIQNIVAVIYVDDEFLLMKKKGTWVGWQFVQGGKEKGEEWDTAVKREIQEETGLTDVEITKKLDIKTDYWFMQEGEKIHKFQNYFLVKGNKEEKITLSREHSDFKWVKFTEALKEIKFNKEEFKKAYQELKKLK